jgi:hypothetical protein
MSFIPRWQRVLSAGYFQTDQCRCNALQYSPQSPWPPCTLNVKRRPRGIHIQLYACFCYAMSCLSRWQRVTSAGYFQTDRCRCHALQYSPQSPWPPRILNVKYRPRGRHILLYACFCYALRFIPRWQRVSSAGYFQTDQCRCNALQYSHQPP